MKSRIPKNNNSEQIEPGISKNKNGMKSINDKIDIYTKRIHSDLQQKGVKDIRRLDILVYLFSDKYINNVIDNKNPILKITAKKHISDLIEEELRILLEEKIEENKELGFSDIQILEELRKLDCSTEVLNVKVPSKKIVGKLQKYVNKFLDEKMENIEEVEKNEETEVKISVESEELVEPTFIEKVRAYTDNFEFLITDIPRHEAERGHYNATKFKSLDDYLKFKEIVDKVVLYKNKETHELQSINNVLRFNDLTEEQKYILQERKEVLERREETR